MDGWIVETTLMFYIGHLAEVSPDFGEGHGFEVGPFDSGGQVLAGAGLPPEVVFVGPAAGVVFDSSHVNPANRFSISLCTVKGQREAVVGRVVPTVYLDSPLARVFNGK